MQFKCMRTEIILERLCKCTGSPEDSLFSRADKTNASQRTQPTPDDGENPCAVQGRT